MPDLAPDPNPHAHLAAALALSNPLNTPSLHLDGLDPAMILRRSYHLGTTPAVAHHLQTLGLGAALTDQDWDHHNATLAQNMMALYAADLASHALEGAGLRCAPLKGYAFLLDLYPAHVGLRRMWDVDLLIDDSTFVRAEAALTEAGFTRRLEAPVTGRLNIEALFVLGDAEAGPTLEVHRRLCFPGRFNISPHELWRAARPADAPPSWRLDPVHALLHLAVHKAQHGYLNDSRDLVDALNITRRVPIDWQRLADAARRWGCKAAAWLFLTRCRRALGMAAPDALLAALAPSSARQRLLDDAMPDATRSPHFLQRRNNRRPLVPKALAGLAAADNPAQEAGAFALIALRSAADRLAASLPDKDLRWIDRIPLTPPAPETP